MIRSRRRANWQCSDYLYAEPLGIFQGEANRVSQLGDVCLLGHCSQRGQFSRLCADTNLHNRRRHGFGPTRFWLVAMDDSGCAGGFLPCWRFGYFLLAGIEPATLAWLFPQVGRKSDRSSQSLTAFAIFGLLWCCRSALRAGQSPTSFPSSPVCIGFPGHGSFGSRACCSVRGSLLVRLIGEVRRRPDSGARTVELG